MNAHAYFERRIVPSASSDRFTVEHQSENTQLWATSWETFRACAWWNTDLVSDDFALNNHTFSP